MDGILTERVAVTVVAGLFGLLPVLLQWLGSIASRRDRATRLKTLRAELDFLEQWQSLRATVAPGAGNPPQFEGGDSVQAELDGLLQEYRDLAHLRRSGSEASDPSGSFIRRLFLLYRPATAIGWLWHTLFYGLLIAALAFLAVGFLHDGFSVDFATGFAGSVVIFGPPLFVVHLLAGRSHRATEAEPGTASRIVETRWPS